MAATIGPAFPRGLPFSGHPFWSDIEEVTSDLARVREVVIREAASAGGPMGEALARYVGRPGKMLRPGLLLVGAWAGKADPGANADERIVEIAAAIETLHLATLIHDDVIDDSDLRRGEPSLHAIYGRKQAVLMGDYLLSRCFGMIAAGTDRENALRLATATGHLVRGEINQMFEAGGDAFSRREYLRRIAGKTAMLFGLSLVTGAAETKAKPREIALLARAGYSMGMAFQVIDDILDFTSHADALGKPAASDLRGGLYTLPVIEAVGRDDSVRELVLPPPADAVAIEKALRAIDSAGGIARARRAANAYTARARRAITRLANQRQREVLAAVAQRLLGRDY
ncbi:MAG: polyprenyl synthetase family protein [Spirochaetota bacterium]